MTANQFVATVSAPVGKVIAAIRYSTNASTFYALYTVDGVGAVGTSKSANAGTAGILTATDAVVLLTSDGGTGGTKDYEIDAIITEFDA